ncbi:unnamed protein product [Bursaphelenchus xylophilus]|uniref:(pine wood nematode) hypothetical protein n=1 Tax=Bursaphelenchus xylophilus TaxID=6326 RepID=A0A1I7RY71_BURXY|nr:unnamed protein product [Bursaphelenchus xylophilus]CAG9085372.1 unnamed protein product [Bursaphelenchus xylophilus]
MILDKSYKLVFKGTNATGSERKYVIQTAFLRDTRTGLHGMLTFKHDAMQVWAILDYDNSFQMGLNKTIEPFDGPLLDVSVNGWGDELTILATTAFSSIYQMAYDEGTEQLSLKRIEVPNALFSRYLSERELILYGTSDGKLGHYSVHGDPILVVDTAENAIPTCLTVSSNGRIIAFGDDKGSVHLHDGDTLTLISTTECCFSCVTDIAFVADNQLLVAEERGAVQLYSWEDLGPETTWSKIRSYCAHEGSVNKIALCSASNGERFATTSDDSTVCIWELGRDEVVHRFQYENEAVCSLCFSPDGLHLGVSTDEGNTYVYTVPEYGEFNEEQYFIPFDDFSHNFWLLQGFTVFDAQALRKQMGVYNDEEEALIFIKHKLDPNAKLREIFAEFEDEMALKQQEEEEELRAIREERERQQRLMDRKMQMDLLREAAQKEGVEFVEPELDPSDEQYLQELQDMQDENENLGQGEGDQTLAEMAGVDISDSDSDAPRNYEDESDVPKSPVLPNGDRSAEEEISEIVEPDGGGQRSGDDTNEDLANQLWATDDEEEGNNQLKSPVQERGKTKTEEELRKIFDECIDTTADLTNEGDLPESGPEPGSSPPPNNNEPRSPLTDHSPGEY